jgi:hypothetical protein
MSTIDVVDVCLLQEYIYQTGFIRQTGLGPWRRSQRRFRQSSSPVWTTKLYFVPAEAPRSIRYFDFASKRIRPIFEVDKGLGTGLSVSSDGRWILYSQDRSVTGDIMLVDHFQ